MKGKSILFLLLTALFAPLAANAQSESTLTVCGDNTCTNEYVPIYGYYCDEKPRSEFIIPAEKLSAMDGGIVSGMKFYLSSTGPLNDISTTFNVFFKEVEATTLTGLTGTAGATSVYTSTISIAKDQSEEIVVEVDIPFSTNYVYGGGNLLIGFYQTGNASYNHIYWIGEKQTGNTAWNAYASLNGYGRAFIPKITFTYETSTTPNIILPGTATVMAGFTTTLSATTINVTGTPSITYTSDNTCVATVSGSGTTATVTGIAPGTATITATMTVSGIDYYSTCAVTVEDPSYCTPGTGGVDGDGIYNVTFGSNGVVVNNTVSAVDYGDYSDQVGAVEAGTNGFEVAITYKTGFTYGTIIWVDWNKNYIFEGDTEVVYAGQAGNANPTTLTATFDVPSTAAGDYRLRIIGADMGLDNYTGSISAAANADPCGFYYYSTCHDYTLRVIPEPYTKTIIGVGEEGWAEGKGGYYLIASPLADAADPATITGMTTGDYDLYIFDQAEAAEWRNYKVDNFDLVNGQGYLYANKNDVTLSFTGMPYSGNGQVTLNKTDDNTVRFQGWNLVGNPFNVTAYINKPFYTLENSDTYTENAAGAPIQAMQGLLVVADSDGETLTFSTVAPGKKAGMLNMNLSKGHSLIDHAIISFNDGQQLPKLQFRQNSTKVYMPKEGQDYAIVSTESNVGEIPVSFKAANNGTYTLSFTSEEVSFAYLHLIDNISGADVDLLANPSYTFDAKTTDYESRFKLVFATGNNSDDDAFAFFSNGSYVINNPSTGSGQAATLQVVDMMGRILKSESINDCSSVDINAAQGVYMLRLINGNDVKVQKIVVR